MDPPPEEPRGHADGIVSNSSATTTEKRKREPSENTGSNKTANTAAGGGTDVEKQRQEDKVNEEDALKEIQQIVQSLALGSTMEAYFRAKEVLPRVIQLLEEHPCLAKQKIGSCFPLELSRPVILTPDRDPEGRDLPLFFVAFQRGATLKQVKKVYNLYPEAVHDISPRDGSTPLHRGIKCGFAAAEIIEFMAVKYPQALQMRDHYGCLPIHWLLSVGQSHPRSFFFDDELEDQLVLSLENLFQLYPESFGTEVHGNSLLMHAVLHNAPEKVIDKILECLAQRNETVESFIIDSDIPTRAQFTVASTIGKLLRPPPASPSLDYHPHQLHSISLVSCCSALVPSGVFKTIMNAFQNGDTSHLRSVKLALPVGALLECQDTKNHLTRGLANLQNLSLLSLTCNRPYDAILVQEMASLIGRPGSSEYENSILEAIVNGIIASEHSMQGDGISDGLHLSRMQLANPRPFYYLFQSRYCPEQVVLRGVDIVRAAPGQSVVARRLRLKSLLIRDKCRIQCQPLQDMLGFLSRGPGLEKLVLKDEGEFYLSNGDYRVNISECIVNLMMHGTLKELALDVPISISGFTGALRNNTSLKTARLRIDAQTGNDGNGDNESQFLQLSDVLATDNVTLEFLAFDGGTRVLPNMCLYDGKECSYRDKMNHLLLLNKYGRGMMRTNQAPVAELLDAVTCIEDEFEMAFDVDKPTVITVEPALAQDVDLVKLSLHYGLLMENPSVWTSQQRRVPSS